VGTAVSESAQWDLAASAKEGPQDLPKKKLSSSRQNWLK
jgi:hypothetical protein